MTPDGCALYAHRRELSHLPVTFRLIQEEECNGHMTVIRKKGSRTVNEDTIRQVDAFLDTVIMSRRIGKKRRITEECNMKNSALVIIDLQNDITKHYKEIIESVNAAIDWAVKKGLHIVYIQHNNLSAGTRTFKPETHGAELVPEMKVVSDHIFTKSKSNALTSEAFAAFIQENSIDEFYIVGADAAACIKSTCFNMTKSGYTVHVLSDCITSYDKKKLPEMLAYYESKGCEVLTLRDLLSLQEKMM